MAGLISPSDIVNLIQAITAAVETVQGNKEECKIIAARVKRIDHALNQRESKESSETLHGLYQTLKEILVFVQKFSDASYFRRFISRNTGIFTSITQHVTLNVFRSEGLSQLSRRS